MAGLGNHEERVLLAQHLRRFLPAHWAILVGGPREPFLQIDQDGRRADDTPPSPGSCCIVIMNAEDKEGQTYVAADLLQRGLEPETDVRNRGTVAVARGRGWRNKLGDALAAQAVIADASVLGWGQDIIEE